VIGEGLVVRPEQRGQPLYFPHRPSLLFPPPAVTLPDGVGLKAA
jgi:hypothetical protein